MAKVLAVANQKGGVGKTTTVACLGAAYAELGERVLLVDLDPQACLTFSLGLESRDLESTAYQVLLGKAEPGAAVRGLAEGPDLLPAGIELTGCEAVLAPMSDREHRLGSALEALTADYDQILIDCPPALGLLTLNGLVAADSLLVPVQAELLAFRGVDQLLDTVEYEVQNGLNPRLTVLGVLPTQYDPRTRHAKQVIAAISDTYGLAVLEPAIPRSVRFAEAPSAGRTVLATARRSRGAEAYRELARRLLAG
ncbi:MAG: AAA family ATPase [Micromonosporaceae bacterium]|nr:AAA family ATPase [Micromonosporaceae bacterium]